jgi:hypothetical protein
MLKVQYGYNTKELSCPWIRHFEFDLMEPAIAQACSRFSTVCIQYKRAKLTTDWNRHFKFDLVEPASQSMLKVQYRYNTKELSCPWIRHFEFDLMEPAIAQACARYSTVWIQYKRDKLTTDWNRHFEWGHLILPTGILPM